jgi:uncharacterized PurR-regulated membrane protein YhhQ (DUF165 family)
VSGKAAVAAPIAVFVATVVLANWLTTEFGFVPVGFGLVATAGTYAAGFALVARDFIHETSGLKGVWFAIAIGTALSFLLADPFIAAASGVAFAVSELADTAVYTPLRRKHWRTAVVGSSLVGAVVDTALFLSIAFGWAAVTAESMGGQLVAKVLWVAIPVALIGGFIRSRRA